MPGFDDPVTEGQSYVACHSMPAVVPQVTPGYLWPARTVRGPSFIQLPQDVKNSSYFGQKLHSHLQRRVPLALTQQAR